MVSIDGDTSTNDTVLLLANGLAGNEAISPGTEQAEIFQGALEALCIHIAKVMARDGEGATKLIEVMVTGAVNDAEARRAARTIISSALVKAAVHGSDPNWGRVLAAAGRCGIMLETEKIQMEIGGILLVDEGGPIPFDKEKVANHLNGAEVAIKLDLNIGNGRAVAWGCVCACGAGAAATAGSPGAV